jgi:2'-5' RNA ligase
MKTWEDFLLEMEEHKFSSTQVNLPSGIASRIIRWGKDIIPDSDIYDGEENCGREDEIHVTVLFGLHSNNGRDVKKILQGEKLINLRLGKTSIFESENYDVVVLSVYSKDLVRLNKKIRLHCDNTQTHGSYKPHCTIAYVKKGAGKKYVGKDKFEGVQVTIDEIIFSNKHRSHSEIDLH